MESMVRENGVIFQVSNKAKGNSRVIDQNYRKNLGGEAIFIRHKSRVKISKKEPELSYLNRIKYS